MLPIEASPTNELTNDAAETRLTRRIAFYSLTSSLAGFLFGFDTVVISGAEQTIQALWSLDPQVHGLVMASALYGTVIGALFGGVPTDRLGRRLTLIVIGAFYFVSALCSGFATGATTLGVARFIGGLGVGAATVASPLYISEIAPPAWRGRLGGLFQFNIVFGILCAFFSNFVLSRVFDASIAWRTMLGIQALPALIYTVLCFRLPESPRWIASKATKPAQRNASQLWSRRMIKPISLAVLIALFNQLSGINAVLYFAPRIFAMAGMAEQAAKLQSIGIGVTNLIFTFVGLWFIDKLGRRTCLYIGCVGYIASLGLTSWAFHTQHYAIVPACLFAFIGAHAVGQGAVIWVFIAEIFPDRQRAGGQALGSFTHWIAAALLTTFFPRVVATVPPAQVFLFFCTMMMLQLVWIKVMVPETKGVPLEGG